MCGFRKVNRKLACIGVLFARAKNDYITHLLMIPTSCTSSGSLFKGLTAQQKLCDSNRDAENADGRHR